MDRSVNHDAVADLLGAYALDALDHDERDLVADHLAHCPRCAAEVADHHEVAGLIANVGADAPPELWDRIADRIAGATPGARAPAPLAIVAGRGSRSSRPAWRRRTAWTAGAAAAAAVAAVAVLAVQVARLDDRVTQADNAIARQSEAQAVLRVVLDPKTRAVALTAPSGGRDVARLFILPSGAGYAVNDALPALAGDRTYQLWGFVGGQPVSLGVLTGHPTYAPFSVDPSVRITTFAVTDEKAGGVPRPTRAPVAASTTTT